MEITSNPPETVTERPEFLKILCILSFVACGLMILIYSLGSLTLLLSGTTIEEIWPQVIESNSQFENLDGVAFFKSVGLVCVFGLLANIVSLLGAIMMWRMEKIGFYLYAVAEIVSNFLSLGIDMGESSKSYGGLIFWIVVDVVFIVMYYMNLKHMNKNVQQ